jgi:peptidoglycan/xylan/chitin deacetylase (PgdA/CDA1 family)/broad-specificity NMP kinase
MIIELSGLPGSGKTALAEAMRARGAVLVPLPSRGRLLLNAGLFWFLHPCLAMMLLVHVLRTAPRGVLYELLVNGYAGYAARYRQAYALSCAGATTVLDQGFFQLAVSLGKLPASILKKLPKPDVLVIVEVDASVREARMAARGWAPRAEFGANERLVWQQHAEAALSELVEAQRRSMQIRHYDGTRDPGEGAKELLASVTKDVHNASAHGYAKTAVALAAWCIAQVARIFRPAPQVVVLMYHTIDRSGWKLAVSPETFERQMRHLARHAAVVPLSDIVLYAKREKMLPSRAIAVSFDDGYEDVLTTALPTLERYHIPATVFIPSDFSVRTDPEGRPRLDEEGVRSLDRSPLITIGSHAMTHRKMTELSPEDLSREAEGSAEALARVTGERPRFFAYPFGARTPEAERTVRDAGYDAAFGITEGTIRPGDDLFRLKRVQVDSTMSFLLFRLRLTSAVDWNRRIVDTLRL